MMKLAFLDELRKISAAKDRLLVAKARKGRRPMRVDTLLRKEKEGTLFKQPKTAGQVEQSSLEYSEGDPKTGKSAAPRPKKGDVPSREGGPYGPKAENRQDAQGTLLRDKTLEPNAANKPTEYTAG